MRTPDAKLLLPKTVNNIHPLSEEDFDVFYNLFRPFASERKQTLTLAGREERYLYFVIEGLQRMYYLDEQNRKAALLLPILEILGEF